MRKPLVLPAVLVAAGVVFWWGAFGGAPHRLHNDAAQSDSGAASRSTASVTQGSMALPTPGATDARKDSLRGTQADGALHLDERQQPIADRELRRLFDYFLSHLGERTPTQIRQTLSDYLRSRWPPSAVDQVMIWYDAYVVLEQSAASLAQTGGDPRAAVARLRQLRQERMGPEIAEAWWGDEDRYLDYTLARQDLLADKRLDARERQRRLDALDGTLDPARQALRRQEALAELSLAQDRDFAEREVPPPERFVERESPYGPEAAQRLAKLDAQQAQWQQRLRDYAAQRRGILDDRSLDPAQRQLHLQALLARSFDGNESRRVDVLIRNNLLPASQ